jgi:FkbM family methyltransferase
MTLFDVGANIGFFSLLGARLVGEAGRVVAFEADPAIALRLRENVQRNQLSWIATEQKAVWRNTGPLFFERADPKLSPDLGLGHVASFGVKDSIQVEGVSLDEYALRMQAPDFVKCDVEGAEVEVFQGAQTILTEMRPVVLCELHSDENRRILAEGFSRMGYGCQDCGQNHILALPR